MRADLDRATDDWYDSEPPTRLGFIQELQRIRRRTVVRPLSVIALAALLTSAIVYKLATRKTPVEAEVVLALSEGALSAKHNGIPVDELRDYVGSVLLPNAKLAKVLEKHKLARVRPGFGIDAVVTEFRENFEIAIWKNSFMYYDEDAENAEHSARIGITYRDIDGDRAFEVAHDLAGVVIETAGEQHQELANLLAVKLGLRRKGLEDTLDQLAQQRSQKLVALDAAKAAQQGAVAQGLALELVEIEHHQKRAEQELATIATSRDALADRIATAGLDMSIQVVDEQHPERPASHGFLIAMLIAVVGVGSLLGSALLIGAFDSRIHEVDDIERLGLPVLGHVPGFPGDGVGSLHDRGASRARVPSFLRWRSHR